MEQTKRIEYIDALRGFAMILVIYFHIPSYCLGNAYIGFNDILEWVRMPLFFSSAALCSIKQIESPHSLPTISLVLKQIKHK